MRYNMSQVDTDLGKRRPDGQGTHNTARFKDRSERLTVALLGISSWNIGKWRHRRSSQHQQDGRQGRKRRTSCFCLRWIVSRRACFKAVAL